MQRDAGQRGARAADEERVVDDVKRSGDILYRQREHAKCEPSAIDIEVPGLVDTAFRVVIQHVVGTGNDAGGTARAEPGRHYFAEELAPMWFV